MLHWRDSSGKTDASSPRSAGFARGGLTVEKVGEVMSTCSRCIAEVSDSNCIVRDC
ncbi:hypothetical protein HUG20_14910 [Salicibibacter cibi]|uniref:Uncharacterized protein n=1 Tax=Salicibibacter cibi TaxID=2743001 RepID=A0A7T6ZCP0_9BACI|nr:hypothetical protein [Salicibibacter cibi]QQK81058.1 hypothetical protein HUG20_14910 [Salicibibacter cibi]